MPQELFDLGSEVDWRAPGVFTASPWTMVYADPKVEAAFTRFHTRGGVLTSIVYNIIGLAVATAAALFVTQNLLIITWFVITGTELAAVAAIYLAKPKTTNDDLRLVRWFEWACIYNAFGTLVIGILFAVWGQEFDTTVYSVNSAFLIVVVMFLQVFALRVVRSGACVALLFLGELGSYLYDVGSASGFRHHTNSDGQLVLVFLALILFTAVVAALTMAFETTVRAHFARFVAAHVRGATLEENRNLKLTYALPQDTVLSGLFGTVERSKHRLGVVDYSICQSSVEQVFLRISAGAQANE